MVSKWKELGRVGKGFSWLKRLISSGLRSPFDDMEEKYSVFFGSSILGQGNRNNCVEGDARSKHSSYSRLMFAMFLMGFNL